MNNQVSRRAGLRSRRRLGYTLLEIMTAVTLGLMLMYAVARIFSRVGGQMNETMSTMEMNNALRNAKNRLTADLEALSVTPQAPRNSRMNEGYLCYVEGLGGPFPRVHANSAATGVAGFATGDVALDTERYEVYNETDFNSDSTIGDLDDILSFTAKAPAGQPFRGRYIKPIYAYDGNGRYIADAQIGTFESQYAEIVWFVRGTTLYRRVLPLLSDEMLQESLKALKYAATDTDERGNAIGREGDELTNVAYENVKMGYGFYYFYDVSVHLGKQDVVAPDGSNTIVSYVVANSLGDLTNRENRYFYWNSCGLHAHPDRSGLAITPAPLHGQSDAWYWLRMATLQESAAPNFRAGAPFGQDYFARDSFVYRNSTPNNYGGWARQLYGGANNYSSDPATDYWLGAVQNLTFTTDAPLPGLNTGTYNAADLPRVGAPFIDYWQNPNVWDEVNWETGDLGVNASDLGTNAGASEKAFNQDVILTNVISFNVKVWDDNCNAYVDLGSCAGLTDANGYNVGVDDPSDFRSLGFYAFKNQGLTDQIGGSDVFPWLPAVYDTWTEQYQRDLYLYDEINNTTYATGAMSDIPSDGAIAASQLKNLPPPYTQRVKSMQIELRVFDPRSKNVRNATFNVDLSRL